MPITEWSAAKAAQEAKKNAIIVVYGTSKTGKSTLCASTHLPLYVAHLDPNNNMQEHLLARQAQFPDAWTAAPLFIPPTPYKMLTQEMAQHQVETLEQFAADARARALTLDEPGVFVIDGGKRLKGLVEKWKLGESATLGFRAAAGTHGPSPIEYAESNAYFNDIVNAFVGSNLHLIITYEAKANWVDYTDDRGKKARKPNGTYSPKMSGGKDGEISYTLNALMETLVEAEKGPVVENKQTYRYVHKLRFDYIGFVGLSYLRNRTMPAMGFDQLLELFHQNIPADELLDPVHAVQREEMDDGLTPAEEE